MHAFIRKDVDATKEKVKHPTDLEYKQQLISRTISSQVRTANANTVGVVPQDKIGCSQSSSWHCELDSSSPQSVIHSSNPFINVRHMSSSQRLFLPPVSPR